MLFILEILILITHKFPVSLDYIQFKPYNKRFNPTTTKTFKVKELKFFLFLHFMTYVTHIVDNSIPLYSLIYSISIY